MINNLRSLQRLCCRFAICPRQTARPELHTSEPAHHDDGDIEQIRPLDRGENRPPSGSRRLTGIRAPRPCISKQPECPAVMRRVKVTLRNYVELFEELFLGRDWKGNAEEVGALDLVPKLHGTA